MPRGYKAPKKPIVKNTKYWGKVILINIVRSAVARFNVMTINHLSVIVGLPVRDTATNTALSICLYELGWVKFRLSSGGRKLKWAYRRTASVRTPAYVMDLNGIYTCPNIPTIEPRDQLGALPATSLKLIDKTD